MRCRKRALTRPFEGSRAKLVRLCAQVVRGVGRSAAGYREERGPLPVSELELAAAAAGQPRERSRKDGSGPWCRVPSSNRLGGRKAERRRHREVDDDPCERECWITWWVDSEKLHDALLEGRGVLTRSNGRSVPAKAGGVRTVQDSVG